MLKTQKQELEEFSKNFEKLYENKKPKPSKQILNWMKIRDYAVKQNKFDKVEEATIEINKLQKKDMEKFENEKEKKLSVEIGKIIRRHENEKNALQMKKSSIIDFFNQTKDKNIEQIQKKYEAKMKELKNYQNFEMSNFDKITKGITKPCARIQCIVSSTAGNQEDENEVNEIKGGEEYDEEEDEENKIENKNEENGEKKEKDNITENNNEGDEGEENGKEEEIVPEEKKDEYQEENEQQGFETEEHEENINENEEEEEGNIIKGENYTE